MNRDRSRLQLILDLIGRIRRRLENVPREALFDDDRDELDLTAFRLLHIGENTNKLSPELKARHPQIAWATIYQLRNVVAHGYEQIDPARIWDVIGARLLELANVCEAELASKS